MLWLLEYLRQVLVAVCCLSLPLILDHLVLGYPDVIERDGEFSLVVFELDQVLRENGAQVC